MGFSDFAGSTLVKIPTGAGEAPHCHELCRTANTVLTGPSTRCLAHPCRWQHWALFILWLGWFGFNGGSQLALGSGADAAVDLNIFINTNMAAAAGVVAAMLASPRFMARRDLTMALNGAIGVWCQLPSR